MTDTPPSSKRLRHVGEQYTTEAVDQQLRALFEMDSNPSFDYHLCYIYLELYDLYDLLRYDGHETSKLLQLLQAAYMLLLGGLRPIIESLQKDERPDFVCLITEGIPIPLVEMLRRVYEEKGLNPAFDIHSHFKVRIEKAAAVIEKLIYKPPPSVFTSSEGGTRDSGVSGSIFSLAEHPEPAVLSAKFYHLNLNHSLSWQSLEMPLYLKMSYR